MVKRHLPRLIAPESWPIDRKKGVKWIARPSPGPHALMSCITINLLLQNLLKQAKTASEVKKLLYDGKVLVNKKARKDHRFPVGVMDVLDIPIKKEHFRVLYTPKGKFMLHKISEEESKIKPSKITGKTTIKGKKTQLNLSDGRCMIVEKDGFKVGDTLMLSMGDTWAIKKHIKFDKGAKVYIVEGKYKGMSGTIEDVKQVFRNPTITVKSKNKTFETSKHFAFIIDDSVSLGEDK